MNESYNKKILVSSAKEYAFRALTEGVREWWGAFEGKISKEGDVFTMTFDETAWKFRVFDVIENEKIGWECIEARHMHPGLSGIEKEWLGTKVYWSIREKEKGVEIELLHEGLVPELNCYDVCKDEWGHFFLQGLKNYLEK